MARAREIIPVLQQYGDLDIVLSGDQSQLELPVEPAFFNRGLTLMYNSRGGISYRKILLKNNFWKILQEIWLFPVEHYDIIINDFEFTTAWACRLRNKLSFGMGHQASFYSRQTPRPKSREWLGEVILKYYAPCTIPIGFHFDHFDDFIEKPVIRREIREAVVTNSGHYTVYLPAFGDNEIYDFLSAVPQRQWQVFSRSAKRKYQRDNISFFPASNENFIKSLLSSEGVLTSAGFETPAEAIYLGKKLMVVPIAGHYEQYCNAAALNRLGVPSVDRLDDNALELIRLWVFQHEPIQITYPDLTERIILERIIMPFFQSQQLPEEA